MFTYHQKSGRLETEDVLLYTGYSGYMEGKNNPDLERVHDVGPIPKGEYSISEPFDSPDHGPYCLRLTPTNGTDTHGRDGFLMHGDRVGKPPGFASRGCVIMPHFVRESVYKSGDRRLNVVE